MKICETHYEISKPCDFLDFDSLRIYLPSGSCGLIYDIYRKQQNEEPSEIKETIAIIRDPIERWLSVVNHFRGIFSYTEDFLNWYEKNLLSFELQGRKRSTYRMQQVFWMRTYKSLIDELKTNETMRLINHIMPQCEELKNVKLDRIVYWEQLDSVYDKIVKAPIDVRESFWSMKPDNNLKQDEIDALKNFYRKDYEIYNDLVF